MQTTDLAHSAAEELRLSDFDYALPQSLIAQTPALQRDAARLLVLDRGRRRIRHSMIRDLPMLLEPGDLLVLNDTKVRKARLRGRTAQGRAVEILLLSPLGDRAWACLAKPGRSLRLGTRISFGAGGRALIVGFAAGRYQIEFDSDVDVLRLMETHGEVPLPPYIKRPSGATVLDEERYQTVFATREGAIAAPTAGLHFTPELLAAIRGRGTETAWVTLHVGAATFMPVREEHVERHRTEPEWASVPQETADAIARARARGGRVVAVGTTTTRALESMARKTGGIAGGDLWADAFITPGFQFRVIDALLTNFHLPRSTLLMLVSAFAGRELILDTYAMAVRERYRFYSYGDAMLIL
jgi:S-adenosylmethionine:tRNA ribosyltransferase-isomerase